jgi:hypothetical protein
MPTRRIPIHRRVRHPITPEAIAAYQAGDDMALHQALNLKPWQPSVLEVDEDPPEWGNGLACYTTEWALVRQLRLALDLAIAEIAAAEQEKRVAAPSTPDRNLVDKTVSTKRGRPTIKKDGTSLTDTERKQRWRAKKKQQAGAAPEASGLSRGT